MSEKIELLKFPDHTRVYFLCPGCGEGHGLPVSGEPQSANWQWNGSMDKPTLTPSILARSGHYAGATGNDGCWCTYNAEHPDDPVSFKCTICHSFVTDGRIQFLSDCTHELSGQTIDLPNIASASEYSQ